MNHMICKIEMFFDEVIRKTPFAIFTSNLPFADWDYGNEGGAWRQATKYTSDSLLFPSLFPHYAARRRTSDPQKVKRSVAGGKE